MSKNKAKSYLKKSIIWSAIWIVFFGILLWAYCDIDNFIVAIAMIFVLANVLSWSYKVGCWYASYVLCGILEKEQAKRQLSQKTEMDNL